MKKILGWLLVIGLVFLTSNIAYATLTKGNGSTKEEPIFPGAFEEAKQFVMERGSLMREGGDEDTFNFFLWKKGNMIIVYLPAGQNSCNYIQIGIDPLYVVYCKTHNGYTFTFQDQEVYANTEEEINRVLWAAGMMMDRIKKLCNLSPSGGLDL